MEKKEVQHVLLILKVNEKTRFLPLWQLGIPHKGNYWSNITKIQFFKINEKMAKQEDSYLEEFLEIKNIQVLSSVSFRFFDNESFVIIFNENNNSLTLEYA